MSEVGHRAGLKMGRHSSNIMIECVKVGEVFCGNKHNCIMPSQA